MKIGIICPSEIALRRFMPALQKIKEAEYIGLGVCSKQERFAENFSNEEEINDIMKNEYAKAKVFADQYGGKIFDGYQEIVTSDEIDAIYIPLPPALHFKWAKQALENGKHVLVEKPSTTSAKDTLELIRLARQNKLALHENYMFNFHNQMDALEDIIKSGEIGDIRLYRISFGFPMRAANDFRYNKTLGGGALIDAGGYTIKYAVRLLGASAKIRYAQMNYLNEYEVDMYGSAAMTNDEGVTVQISFGMDNDYKCELDVWGSKGCLITGRVLTAPAGFVPQVIIKKGAVTETRNLPADDAFEKSIRKFLECIDNYGEREKNYSAIEKQAKMVDEFKHLANFPIK